MCRVEPTNVLTPEMRSNSESAGEGPNLHTQSIDGSWAALKTVSMSLNWPGFVFFVFFPIKARFENLGPSPGPSPVWPRPCPVYWLGLPYVVSTELGPHRNQVLDSILQRFVVEVPDDKGISQLLRMRVRNNSVTGIAASISWMPEECYKWGSVPWQWDQWVCWCSNRKKYLLLFSSCHWRCLSRGWVSPARPWSVFTLIWLGIWVSHALRISARHSQQR